MRDLLGFTVLMLLLLVAYTAPLVIAHWLWP